MQVEMKFILLKLSEIRQKLRLKCRKITRQNKGLQNANQAKGNMQNYNNSAKTVAKKEGR